MLWVFLYAIACFIGMRLGLPIVYTSGCLKFFKNLNSLGASAILRFITCSLFSAFSAFLEFVTCQKLKSQKATYASAK